MGAPRAAAVACGPQSYSCRRPWLIEPWLAPGDDRVSSLQALSNAPTSLPFCPKRIAGDVRHRTPSRGGHAFTAVALCRHFRPIIILIALPVH